MGQDCPSVRLYMVHFNIYTDTLAALHVSVGSLRLVPIIVQCDS